VSDDGQQEPGDASVDTVAHAAASPDEDQPFLELGLKDDEYAAIREVLGRRPTRTELAMYSIMWSEHCSYKSSKVHLRQFGDLPRGDRMLVGMGENAGVVDVGEGLAVTFKVESHNHPSYVEPYQGAATGVGGIVRDILTMGPGRSWSWTRSASATPITPTPRGCCPDRRGRRRLRELPRAAERRRRGGLRPQLPGQPAGQRAVPGRDAGRPHPAVGGPGRRQRRRPARRQDRPRRHRRRLGPGQRHLRRDGPARRPSVQVGDPFTEKLLIEACLEMYDAKLVQGIQDLGGAGLTCALTETAAAGRSGMLAHLDRVPLREASMEPHEVLASESQERMLAIVTPEDLPAVLAIAEKWGVLAPRSARSSRATGWSCSGTARSSSTSRPARWPTTARSTSGRSSGPPTRTRCSLRPPRLPAVGELGDLLLRMVASPNLCSRRWVVEQYDRIVLGDTVLAWPEDAGVVRLSESGLGIALATDGNGRYTRLDPYAGAQLALAEAYRNVAATGPCRSRSPTA
jgi:phosphoribosylformylglycinamidine synthase